MSCWLAVTESWVVYSNYKSLATATATVQVAHNMRNSLLTVNILLHHSVLVDTHRCKNIQSVLVTGVNAVKDQANNNLLPSRSSLVPELRFLEVDNVANVLHDTMQCASHELLVFIIVRN